MTAARVDLDRALDALVENALQYSPPGSDRGDRGRAPGGCRSWTPGPALRPARRSRSSSASTVGAPGAAGPAGTGLGLPIARELMRRWDARVWLENRTEGGARAVIAFDRDEPEGGR